MQTTASESTPASQSATALYGQAVENVAQTKAAIELTISDIDKGIDAGDDVSGLQTKHEGLRSQLEVAERTVVRRRPAMLIEEQAQIRADGRVAMEVRRANNAKALEAQKQYANLMCRVDEVKKEIHRWKFANDNFLAIDLRLRAHISEHGDLTGGETK
jgi:hypothetical protein